MKKTLNFLLKNKNNEIGWKGKDCAYATLFPTPPPTLIARRCRPLQKNLDFSGFLVIKCNEHVAQSWAADSRCQSGVLDFFVLLHLYDICIYLCFVLWCEFLFLFFKKQFCPCEYELIKGDKDGDRSSFPQPMCRRKLKVARRWRVPTQTALQCWTRQDYHVII